MTRGHGSMDVAVLHRWRDRYALYDTYLDHDAHRVWYVTTELGAQSVPAGAAGMTVVSATDDPAEVRAALPGSLDRLVALNEGDLDTAAALRAERGLPGQHPGELARFRDKLVMVRRVAAAGIPVPEFADAVDRTAVTALARRVGWPLVCKPRRGTASRGVVLLRGPADRPDLTGEPYLVQRFVPDPIVHIDGLWTGSELGPWRASRYLGSCHEFNQGRYLGSVEIDDRDLLHRLAGFTASVAAALSDRPWVFHLEAFVGDRITFLEAGARVGGAEIPFVWREVHGVDLMSAAAAIQLGRRPVLGPAAGEVGGWLLLPAPAAPPCRVSSVRTVRGAYAAVVPEPGTVIPRVGGYEHVGARFRFRGATSAAVASAIEATTDGFRMRCEPLTETVVNE